VCRSAAADEIEAVLLDQVGQITLGCRRAGLRQAGVFFVCHATFESSDTGIQHSIERLRLTRVEFGTRGEALAGQDFELDEVIMRGNHLMNWGDYGPESPRAEGGSAADC
jgi:hypothetical protein